MSARRVIAGIGDLPLGQVKLRGTRGVRMDWRGLHGAFPARGDAARRAAPVRRMHRGSADALSRGFRTTQRWAGLTIESELG